MRGIWAELVTNHFFNDPSISAPSASNAETANLLSKYGTDELAAFISLPIFTISFSHTQADESLARTL